MRRESLSQRRRREETENARVGYQVANSKCIYESETLWSKFDTMVLANSISMDRLRILNASLLIDLFKLC